MLERDFDITWSTLITGVLTVVSAGAFVLAWRHESVPAGVVGFLCAQGVAVLVILHDNEKTRRVVRAVAREAGATQLRGTR